ncbi:MAG: TetR/AcrR family transcriptional repressor of nem operon [Planctomycetota bacterium]|jgi:TetR/AcrR family transcriptional repressor of nem operon
MARPRTFDEAKVLEGAVALFREHGYEGTSVPELTERLGICRQSLYSAFGDKRGLYLRALERWGDREIDSKVALLESPGSPIENLRTLLRGFAAYATTCPSEGCFTVSAMVENRDDPEALAVVERQVARLEAAYQATLERARLAGEIRVDARMDRLARLLVTTGHGIGLLTRLPNSGPRIGDTVASLLELIDNVAV